MNASVSLMASIEMMSSILDAKTDEEFMARLQYAAQRCGFEKVLVGLQWVDSNGDVQHHISSDYPAKWQELYRARRYSEQDPTVEYCQRSTTPLVWSEEFFYQRGRIEILEEARSFGIGHGISISVHESRGVKSMISLARDRPVNHDPSEEADLLSSARVISSCAHFVYSNIRKYELRSEPKPRLSEREKEALRWVAAGKNSWEIGAIMGISEATTIFHLKNAMEKMDVKNRAQAVAVALRMGLLN